MWECRIGVKAFVEKVRVFGFFNLLPLFEQVGCASLAICTTLGCNIITYDHRLKRIGHPVRFARHKLEIG